MSETLPAPLTPADCDLRSFPFMQLYIDRLRKSRAWLACKRRPELAFYLLNLWMRAWHEVPAASLEDDDDVLADAAMVPPDKWPELREDVLRGWIKCSDGRLYHPVVAEIATEAWCRKVERRTSLETARAAKKAKSENRPVTGTVTVAGPVTKTVTESVTGSVTEQSSGLCGSREGEREGESNKTSSSSKNAVLVAERAATTTTPADRIADAFLAMRLELWPNESGFSAPTMSLRTQAQDWIDQGGHPDLCIEVMRQRAKQLLDSGDKNAPFNLKFCHFQVDRAIRNHNTGVRPRDAPDEYRPSVKTDYDRRVEEWWAGGRKGPVPKPASMEA